MFDKRYVQGRVKVDHVAAPDPVSREVRREITVARVVAGMCLFAVASLLVSCSAGKHTADLSRDLQQEVGLMVTTGTGRKDESLPLPDLLRSVLEKSPWLNTAPLRASDLRGKVVLVNFWTYSCINSLRPLPYLRAWAEKYKDRGLVVIGVHTPEFQFEHDGENVQTAIADLAVDYPVVLGNDFRLWRVFGNNAWPGFYFIDASGRVRHQMLGEGSYDQSERWIQKLLAEVNGAPVSDALAAPAGEGAQAPPDWNNLRTPETYVGYARLENFSSPGGVRRDGSKTYSIPASLPLNHWSLAGSWMIGGEFASLQSASGKIAFSFHARDLHLVLGRSSREAVRFRVTLDGNAPGENHGVDIDAEGWGNIDQDRMYQLIRQAGPVGGRTFEIEFFASGARAYSFTFG